MVQEAFNFFQEIASTYGIMFALFVALLMWVLHKNDVRETRYIEREDKYLNVIQTLSEDVKERLAKIETQIFRGGRED